MLYRQLIHDTKPKKAHNRVS